MKTERRLLTQYVSFLAAPDEPLVDAGMITYCLQRLAGGMS